MRFHRSIQNYLDRHVQVVDKLDPGSIAAVVAVLVDALDGDRMVFTCGNGGSAAVAAHMAADLSGGLRPADGRRMRALCLAGLGAPMLTATSNDRGYDAVFADALAGLMRPGDVLVVFSGSGDSENVVRAARYARQHQGRVIGVYGFAGGRLAGLCDVGVHIEVDDMFLAEDAHVVVNHAVMAALRAELL